MLIELPKAEHKYEIIDIERFDFSADKLDKEVIARAAEQAAKALAVQEGAEILIVADIEVDDVGAVDILCHANAFWIKLV